MKIFRLISVIAFYALVAAPGNISAQTNADAEDHFTCAEGQQREKLIQEHPEILQAEAQFEAFAKEFVANYKQHHDEKALQGPIVIPIV
ncbi:MAG TPA: hypothetical protein VG603_03115, partial [Chitinophagales bacterium]|nr:hypothetical protein [Chitinophagales bacterium]